MLKISLPLRLQLSLVLVIGTALLKPGAWVHLVVYGAIALGWVVLLRVKIPELGKLLGAELLLLSLLALPLGWEKASFLLVRSLICLIIMNSFLLTLPPHSLSIALKSLPIPAVLAENLLLSSQYLEILRSEVTRMQNSAQLRGLNGTGGWLRYASSAMIGALYLRSLDRAERVHNAMMIRGYNGQLPINSSQSPQERFVILTTATICSCLTFSSYFQRLH